MGGEVTVKLDSVTIATTFKYASADRTTRVHCRRPGLIEQLGGVMDCRTSRPDHNLVSALFSTDDNPSCRGIQACS